MKEVILGVSGMTGGMCEVRVNDAVRTLEGVKRVKSSSRKLRTCAIVEEDVSAREIVNAITAQGYAVFSVSERNYTPLFRKK